VLSAPRLRHALLFLVGPGGALAPAFLGSGCGPQPVGVEACRKIEGARCDAAIHCNFTEEDVADCKLVYADQCLHGIENESHRPSETETEACVAAITAAGACAAAGAADMSACPDAPMAQVTVSRSPCDVVLLHAHELAACAFVVGADAGTDTGTGTGSGGGGGAGGSGAN
jgi:hypothetical protein